MNATTYVMDAKWRQRLASKPLVALDVGYVRSMRRDADALPDDFNYVLPEIALLEAATTESASPLGQAKKLARFIQLNQSRVFVAAHLGHLAAAEREPGVTVDPIAIAHHPFLATAEHAGLLDVAATAQAAIRIVGEPNPYRKIQREFEEGRARFASGMCELVSAGSSLGCTAEEEFEKAIMEPTIAAGWATLFHPRYESPEWQAALGVFPDRHAVGRWWRVALWYYLREARGLTQNSLRNDWADALYVFTASYADHFWTADRDARDAVRLLFSRTEVLYLPPQEIRERH